MLSKTSILLPFILKVIKPYKGRFLFFVSMSMVGAVDMALRPYLLKQALDAVQTQVFFDYIFLYLALMGVMFLGDILYEYMWIHVYSSLKTTIGHTIFKELTKKTYAFYQDNFSGSLSTKLNNCINSIPRIVRTFHENFFKTCFAIILSVYTLSYISIHYALGLAMWAGVYCLCAVYLSPFIKKRSIIVAKEASKNMGYIVDVLSHTILIKLFHSRTFEVDRIHHDFKTWENHVIARDKPLVHLYTFQTLSFFVFQGACVYGMLKQNTLTPGNLVLFFSVSFSIYQSLLGLSRVIADFSENIGTVQEALDLIYKSPSSSSSKIPLICQRGHIVFDNVTFYHTTIPLFKYKSVEIRAGEKVGLVGHSGGGKSTFVNLILRLYDVTDGAILIDDQNIQEVSEDSLRQNIAMIPQDPSLFHRSLMENIRYGRMNASDEEVIEAAKKAHAHEFISILPQGYDTLVGERGVKLSGGQRQRIAIARAILKNAPILMLDEATSQLDSVTESLIQESLWALMKNKTTLVIAHRLSTLIHMDRILVFDQGKIVEDGAHDDLLTKGGLYKHLWDAQVGGFLGDDQPTEGTHKTENES